MRPGPLILGPDGRPVFSAARVRQEKASRFNPTVNWTPDVLVRQLTAYARGEIRDLAYLMDWLERTDDTISTVAPKAKAAVSRHGYDVKLKGEIRPEQRQLAEDQRGVLQAFYDSVEVGDAIDSDVHGKFRLLVQQGMDGYGKGYAAHHTIWTPTPQGLRAKLLFVPAWFWETTEGRMRFLPSTWATRGIDREELGGKSAWVIWRGRGVMLACAIARMFKQIPLQDWLTYCDRHGMPAFLGKTGASEGSSGWTQLYDAVTNIGAEFGAVVNTSDSIEVLDLTTKGDLPYEKLIERMDRAMVSLWRGGDLSTMSRQDGTGSNPQQEETDELDADNAVWVGETLDSQLSRTVIDWHFGYHVPQLAELVLRTRTRDNVTQDLAVVDNARKHGIRISKPWFVSKFGIVEADDGEAALGETAAPVAPAPAAVPGINTGDAETLLTDTLATAAGVRADILAPLRPVIARLAEQSRDARISDADFLRLAEEAAASFPELYDATEADKLAKELEAAMGTATAQGARDALRENKQTKNP